MPIYLVERSLPGASLECVAAVQQAAKVACQAFADNGNEVRYLYCTFTPGDSRCRCLFEAPNADLVQRVNDAAQIPYSRIVLAIDLPTQ
jgi:hypothetical protein